MAERKKQVLVVFGGTTPEYKQSCVSAPVLANAISREKYDVYCLGITREGQWLLTNASLEEIADGQAWQERDDNKRAILSPDRGHKGLLVLDGEKWSLLPIDCVFTRIPGEMGEDGKLPALFELAGIPYVGSGVCASACGLDKTITMLFADLCGVKRPAFFTCTAEQFLQAPEAVADQCADFFEKKLGFAFPIFVKPATTGSSIGISKVNTKQELLDAMKQAAPYSERLIVEENISGRELKVAILGNNDDIRIGDICEIMMENSSFNSYALKYEGNATHKIIPADVPEDKADELKKAAVDIYKALGCKDYARVDFFMKDNGDIYFNEINTAPGLGRVNSVYPMMLNSVGISYEMMINEMIAMALGE